MQGGVLALDYGLEGHQLPLGGEDLVQGDLRGGGWVWGMRRVGKRGVEEWMVGRERWL